MSRFLSLGAALALVVLAAWFAALNGAQRVTLRLGVVTLYAFPLVWVVFVAFLTGMLVIFLAGIRSDLKVRRILRDRLLSQGGFPGPGGAPLRNPAPDPAEGPDPAPPSGPGAG